MELSKKNFDKQFTTVTTHKIVQSYYNEKCAKYLMFDVKKYRGVIFHDTEDRYEIWRGINLLFQNWHKEFDKI